MARFSLAGLFVVCGALFTGCGTNFQQALDQLNKQNNATDTQSTSGQNGTDATPTTSTAATPVSQSATPSSLVGSLNLSDASKAVIDDLDKKYEAEQAAKAALCGIDPSVQQQEKAKLDAIVADTSLTNAEKRTQLKAEWDANKTARDAERTAVKTCIANKAGDLKKLNDALNTVLVACLPPIQRHEDSATLLKALEDKLASDECAKARVAD